MRGMRAWHRWRIALRWGVAVGIVGSTAEGTRHMPRPSAPRVTIRVADTTATTHDNAVEAFARGIAEFVVDGGLLTDELREPLSGPGSTRRALGNTLRGVAGGDGGWPYSSKYPWRRLSWMDMRTLPERWDPRDTAMEAELYNTKQETFLDHVYLQLQGTRAILSTALAQLPPPTTIATTDAATLATDRSELYALAGYAEVELADLFCSGVPLNTVAEPFMQKLAVGLRARPQQSEDTEFPDVTSKDSMRAYYQRRGSRWYTLDSLRQPGGPGEERTYLLAMANHLVRYQPSSTTAQVYRDAIATFDTALSMAGASPRVLNLARVGKGRAYLDLGEYDSTAAAVAAVPRGFAYQLRSFWNMDPDGDEILATVADQEGGNGLPYLSSADPRTATQFTPSDKGMGMFRFPAKFWPDSDRQRGRIHPVMAYDFHRYEPWQMPWPFTLASWEEAVLIQAEAALHEHPTAATWLRLLNHLRATAPIPGTSQPAPHRLAPLTDPGTARARLALLFRERAYWLFLTGHRQGDLRRLVREYGWPQTHVYPTGPYPVANGLLPRVGDYGADVNLPIPPEEFSNPHFLGCLDRGA